MPKLSTALFITIVTIPNQLKTLSNDAVFTLMHRYVDVATTLLWHQSCLVLGKLVLMKKLEEQFKKIAFTGFCERHPSTSNFA